MSIPEWTEKKQQAVMVASKMLAYCEDHYSARMRVQKRMLRMLYCADTIRTILCKECGHMEYYASRCKDRLCPVCQWRLSIQRLAEMMSVHDYLMQQDGYINVAMLTLTIKNCSGPQLPQTVRKLLDGWQLICKRRDVQRYVRGYARSIEITNKRGSWHPHLHVLVYFGKDYKKQLSIYDIVRMWRESLGVDYDPICDIRSAYSKRKDKQYNNRHDKITALVAEATKYVMKSELLTQAAPEDILLLDEATKGVRLCSYGGIIRKARSACGITDKDTLEDAEIRADVCKDCGSSEVVEMTWQWALDGYKLFRDASGLNDYDEPSTT